MSQTHACMHRARYTSAQIVFSIWNTCAHACMVPRVRTPNGCRTEWCIQKHMYTQTVTALYEGGHGFMKSLPGVRDCPGRATDTRPDIDVYAHVCSCNACMRTDGSPPNTRHRIHVRSSSCLRCSLQSFDHQAATSHSRRETPSR
jgi:hypothetical protein